MLTDVQCKNAICPPEVKRERLSDSGGLYLEVSPAGSRRWFWKYRKDGKEGRMALGSYPATSLAAARRARDAAKVLKSNGHDPVQVRIAERLKISNPVGDTFRAVALEWYNKQAPRWSQAHADRSLRQFERDLFPWLGDRRLVDITPTDLLNTLRKVEDRGAVETADRELMLVRQVWHYGVATERVQGDITLGLKAALTPYRGTHFAAITDPAKLGRLLQSIDAYRGGPIVRAALQLAPLLFQRPGELRGAAWAEIDLEKAMWTIPAARMKRGKEGKENGAPHLVPLSRQAASIFRNLHPLTGHSVLVFPGERNHDRPISENSVRTALITMGYSPKVHTWHGFRATARTMLEERLGMDPLVIEAQLAHAVKDTNGRSYNRTEYQNQRAAMMQGWADYLDRLRDGMSFEASE